MALINGLLDTAQSCLAESSKTGKTSDEVKLLVRDATEISGLAYECLAFMDGAGIDDLPYPVVSPLQDWFDSLGINNTTFFRAELVANYELRPANKAAFDGIRNQSASLIEAITKIEWPLLRVTVPSKAIGLITHFAIVAHELGHALYNKINWDLTSFSAEEAAFFDRLKTRLGVARLDPAIFKTAQTIFYSWFQELASDAFAFYLAGPASFFAFSELFSFIGGNGISDTHPANDLRIQTLFQKLDDGSPSSFSKTFKKYTGQTLTKDFNSSLVQLTPDSNQLYNDLRHNKKPYSDEKAAVIAELNQSMPIAVDIIYAHVEKFMRTNAPTSIYTPKLYETDFGSCFNAMLAAIPPIETGDSLDKKIPIGFPSIINIGWAVHLTKLGELRVKVSGDNKFGTEKLERLHSLLLKAVELSEARRKWEKA